MFLFDNIIVMYILLLSYYYHTVDYFISGFSILLDSIHFHVLLRALSFIYNQLDLFHGNRRLEIINRLFFKPPGRFKNLFLHWCYVVRRFFHHILIYKVFRTDWHLLPCSNSLLILNMFKEITLTASPR